MHYVNDVASFGIACFICLMSLQPRKIFKINENKSCWAFCGLISHVIPSCCLWCSQLRERWLHGSRGDRPRAGTLGLVPPLSDMHPSQNNEDMFCDTLYNCNIVHNFMRFFPDSTQGHSYQRSTSKGTILWQFWWFWSAHKRFANSGGSAWH